VNHFRTRRTTPLAEKRSPLLHREIVTASFGIAAPFDRRH
jgi:hypothetical protein